MALVLTRTLLLPSTASVYTKLWADNYHLSTESTAYKTGLNRSDTSPCIVCGDYQTVQYYIIRKSEPETVSRTFSLFIHFFSLSKWL